MDVFKERIEIPVFKYVVKGDYEQSGQKSVLRDGEIWLNGKAIEVSEGLYFKLTMEAIYAYEGGSK